jgi:hypothetical protein
MTTKRTSISEPRLATANHLTLQECAKGSGVSNQSRYLAIGALVFRRDHGRFRQPSIALRDGQSVAGRSRLPEVKRTTHPYREAVSQDARTH